MEKQVSASARVLDPLRERDVPAQNQGNLHRVAGGGEGQRVGGHREAWRRSQVQARGQSAQEASFQDGRQVREPIAHEYKYTLLSLRIVGRATRCPLNSLNYPSLWCSCVARLHFLELGMGVFLVFCACYDLAFGRNHYFIYLFLQAVAFLVMGFGYVGTFVPSA